MYDRFIYEDVKACVFKELINIYGKNGELEDDCMNVTLHYEGTNYRGTLRVDVKAGYTGAYKRAVEKVAEIVSKYA